MRTYNPFKSDIWSLGIILAEMITGVFPWYVANHDDALYFDYCCDRSTLQSDVSIADEVMPLLLRMLEPHAERRISAAELEAEIMGIKRFTTDSNPCIPDVVETQKLVSPFIKEKLRAPCSELDLGGLRWHKLSEEPAEKAPYARSRRRFAKRVLRKLLRV